MVLTSAAIKNQKNIRTLQLKADDQVRQLQRINQSKINAEKQTQELKQAGESKDAQIQQLNTQLQSKKAAQIQLASAKIPAKTVTAPVVAFSSAILSKIMYCESGGRVDATNGTHFGLFQFDIGTWNSYGPHVTTGAQIQAMPAAVQEAAALAAFAVRGVGPWVASQSCWG